jgi:hypothetical protein
VQARIWARQTWCTAHHRKTCPPILLDTSESGSVRNPAWVAAQEAAYQARLVAESRVPIAEHQAYGLTTEAWNAERLAATRDGGPDPDSLAHPAWETLDAVWRTPVAQPAYAGSLEDGVATDAIGARVVYCCPAVLPQSATRWEDGRPHWTLDPHRVVLWAFRDAQPDEADADPVIMYGGFPDRATAERFAWDRLHADFVIPRVSRWVLSADAHGEIPQPTAASAAPLASTVERWIRATSVHGLLRPIDPTRIGVWLTPASGREGWWEQAPGVPYQWASTVITTERFQAWMQAHHLIVDPAWAPTS